MNFDFTPEQIAMAIVVLVISAGFWIAGFFTGRDAERMNRPRHNVKLHVRVNRDRNETDQQIAESIRAGQRQAARRTA